MILNLVVTTKNEDEISYLLDSSKLNITFSDMLQDSKAFAELTRLSMGTIDGTIALGDLWKMLKKIKAEDIASITIFDEKGNPIHTIKDNVVNVIYNINFNGPGDMVIFDYKEV